MGQPLGQGLRTCWLSLSAADALHLDAPTRSCAYYVAFLRFLGCTSHAAEFAVLVGGDDVAFDATMAPALHADAGENVRFFVRHLAEDLPLHRRVGRVLRALPDPGGKARTLAAHCEVGARLAARLDMPEAVCEALAHAYERWDAKGYPAGLGGEQVRVVNVARDAEVWVRQAGWAGGVEAEPSPVRTIADGLDAALEAVADFADLKSPWFRGHSTRVADLVAAAAAGAGLSDGEAATLRCAGLVHDVGKVGVTAGSGTVPAG